MRPAVPPHRPFPHGSCPSHRAALLAWRLVSRSLPGAAAAPAGRRRSPPRTSVALRYSSRLSSSRLSSRLSSSSWARGHQQRYHSSQACPLQAPVRRLSQAWLLLPPPLGRNARWQLHLLWSKSLHSTRLHPSACSRRQQRHLQPWSRRRRILLHCLRQRQQLRRPWEMGNQLPRGNGPIRHRSSSPSSSTSRDSRIRCLRNRHRWTLLLLLLPRLLQPQRPAPRRPRHLTTVSWPAALSCAYWWQSREVMPSASRPLTPDVSPAQQAARKTI